MSNKILHNESCIKLSLKKKENFALKINEALKTLIPKTEQKGQDKKRDYLLRLKEH